MFRNNEKSNTTTVPVFTDCMVCHALIPTMFDDNQSHAGNCRGHV